MMNCSDVQPGSSQNNVTFLSDTSSPMLVGSAIRKMLRVCNELLERFPNSCNDLIKNMAFNSRLCELRIDYLIEGG